MHLETIRIALEVQHGRARSIEDALQNLMAREERFRPYGRDCVRLARSLAWGLAEAGENIAVLTRPTLAPSLDVYPTLAKITQRPK